MLQKEITHFPPFNTRKSMILLSLLHLVQECMILLTNNFKNGILQHDSDYYHLEETLGPKRLTNILKALKRLVSRQSQIKKRGGEE